MDLFPHVWDEKRNKRDQPLTPSFFNDRVVDLSSAMIPTYRLSSDR